MKCFMIPNSVVDCSKDYSKVKQVFDYLMSCKDVDNKNLYKGNDNKNIGINEKYTISYLSYPIKIYTWEEFLFFSQQQTQINYLLYLTI